MHKPTLTQEARDEEDFSETELAILDVLEEGRGTPGYIAERLDRSGPYIRGRLNDLERLGLIEKIHRGLYGLQENEEDQDNE